MFFLHWKRELFISYLDSSEFFLSVTFRIWIYNWILRYEIMISEILTNQCKQELQIANHHKTGTKKCEVIVVLIFFSNCLINNM